MIDCFFFLLFLEGRLKDVRPSSRSLSHRVSWSPLAGCGCLNKCCSLNCSICCFVFSLWGFIMLVSECLCQCPCMFAFLTLVVSLVQLVLGSLLSSNYTPIHHNELTPEGAATAASGSYAAAGIYAGLMVICAVRFAYIMIKRHRVDKNYMRV